MIITISKPLKEGNKLIGIVASEIYILFG